MNRKTLSCTIRMDSYIAHPYWPEKNTVVDIQKKSGMNRVRSDDKRNASLKAYLESIGLTTEEYAELVRLSERHWYREDGEATAIVIPRHQLSACLVECVKTAASAVRGKYKEGSLRHQIQLSDFVTEKTEADDVFERYVKLETSNQRSHQCNEVIQNFDATGTMFVDTETKIDPLKRFIDHAVEEIGLGACRKMGYGRGTVIELK